jgi:hypothetical protein
MYTLMRAIPRRQLLLEQIPLLATSFVIAELFYKFGSFAVECSAFLATWLVIDALVHHAREAFAQSGQQ